jgi:hypothetical protein
MFLAEQGIRPLIVERERFPRCHIHDSLTGAGGKVLRSYETEDEYSVPIGSRSHPERAPIWQTNSPIQSSEEWMGPR